MDCPRCGTTNMRVARFCRRCGQDLGQADTSLVLAAMNTTKRAVRTTDLHDGRVVPTESWDLLKRGVTYLGDVAEAFLEAGKHEFGQAAIRLTRGGWEVHDLVIEAGDVVARFHVNWPYVRIEFSGPRDEVRRLTRRVVAAYGEDLFTALDGNWDRFEARTGLSQAENKTTLLDLLS